MSFFVIDTFYFLVVFLKYFLFLGHNKARKSSKGAELAARYIFSLQKVDP